MKRVALLVTGSREYTWDDRGFIQGNLAPYKRADWDVVLIHGAQGVMSEMGRPSSGLDLLAADVAEYTFGWKTLPMPAPWESYPNQAGPIRNSCMVKLLEQLRTCGYECSVLAFPMPNSVGTHDCITKANRSGFEVTAVEPRP